jgi:DNA-binding transcriptional regulator of glucitol operon
MQRYSAIMHISYRGLAGDGRGFNRFSDRVGRSVVNCNKHSVEVQQMLRVVSLSL